MSFMLLSLLLACVPKSADEVHRDSLSDTSAGDSQDTDTDSTSEEGGGPGRPPSALHRKIASRIGSKYPDVSPNPVSR